MYLKRNASHRKTKKQQQQVRVQDPDSNAAALRIVVVCTQRQHPCASLFEPAWAMELHLILWDSSCCFCCSCMRFFSFVTLQCGVTCVSVLLPCVSSRSSSSGGRDLCSRRTLTLRWRLQQLLCCCRAKACFDGLCLYRGRRSSSSSSIDRNILARCCSRFCRQFSSRVPLFSVPAAAASACQ